MNVRIRTISIAGLALVLTSGCSKPTTPGVDAAATPSATGSQTAQSSTTTGSKSLLSRMGVDSSKSTTDHGQLALPAGTIVTVRLAQSVSSATAQAGDRFEATLDEPIVVDGHTLADRGANAYGHVVAAQHSGRLSHPGYLRLALDSVVVDGKPLDVQSSAVSAKAASHKKRNVAWIGGSTAGGALIGGLMGGGKGALIGGLIGAGGGTTTAALTGKKDVVFAAERRLTFRVSPRTS